VYNFTGGTKNFGTAGSMDYFKVSERYDLKDGNKNNKLIYKYFNEPDGYPKYKDSPIDESYKYFTEETDSKGLTTRYQYNSKHQMYLKQQIKDKVLFESWIAYQNIYNLPERYDNKTFNETGDYITKTDLYKYDFRGNLIEENHPESNMDISSEERKITYSYSYEYNLLTSKRYKQDKDTEVQIKYDLSEDRKNVASEGIYSNGNLTTLKNYNYDNTGNMISISQEKEPGKWSVSRFEYDSKYKNAYLTAVIYEGVKDVDGYSRDIKLNYDYDLTTGNRISVTDGNGNLTSYEYDVLNRITKEILPDNLSHTYSYDDKNNILIRSDANGNSLTYYYDSIGNLLKVLEPAKNIQLAEFQYDEEETLIGSYDGNKNLIQYTYDDLRRITSVTNMDSNSIVLQRKEIIYDNAYVDRYGNKYYRVTVREKGDVADRIMHYYFDSFERLVKLGREVDSREETAYYNFNYLGSLVENTDFAGSKTSNVYDSLGRIIKTIDARGKERKFTYDGLGNMISTTDELGITVFAEYDSLGRKTLERIPFDGSTYSVTKSYYDNSGNLTKTIDPEGYVTKQFYNNRNLVYGIEQVIDSKKSNVVKIEYDGEGNTLSILKGLTGWNDTPYSSQSFEYDELNRLTVMADASNNKTLYQYDNNGNLVKQADRNDIITEFKYDGLNRLVEKENSKDGSKTAVKISYDLLGDTQKISDASGETLFDYDVLGRLMFTNYQNGIKKYYEYDSSDRVTNFKVMQGGMESINLEYEYDKVGRLAYVNEGGKKYNYQFDDAGRLLEEENKVTGLKSFYTYYPSGQLKNLNHYIADELNNSFSYTYDMKGNEIEKDENGTITKYHYDALGRLKTAELPGDRLQDYEYDNLSNRAKLVEIDGNYIKETAYVYDKDSRLILSETKAGDDLTEQRFEYDPQGNLGKSIETFKYNGNLTAEKELEYQYNGYNQLAMVQDPEEKIYEYTYDWQGLRTKKAFGDEVINFINEGGNTIIETDRDMQITARNIRGIKLIYRETDVASSDSTYLGYIHNGHGDIIGLTNENGNIVKDYAYDPFGRDDIKPREGFGNNRTTQIWMDEVEEIDNPFRYSGEYYDEETGNIYLRARYYNPSIGRFTQEDTFWGDGLNIYTYVHNNPLTYIDPSGHVAEVSNGSWYNPVTGNIVDKRGNAGGSTDSTLGKVMRTNPNSYPYDMKAEGFNKSQQYYLAWYYGTKAYERLDNATLSHNSYLVYKLDKLRKAGDDLSKLTVAELDKMSFDNASFWYKADSAALATFGAYNTYLFAKGTLKTVELPDTKFTTSKLQHELKHAGDFGVTGNWNKATGEAYQKAVQTHINTATDVYKSTYRGQDVNVFINKSTGVGAYTDLSGSYIGGWKFSTDQMNFHLTNGTKIK